MKNMYTASIFILSLFFLSHTSAQVCFIGPLQMQALPCVEGEAYVWVNFNYDNTSDSFHLTTSSGASWTFAYTDLPIEIGPFTENDFGGGGIAMVASDLEHPQCANDGGLEEFPCEPPSCSITDLIVEPLPCDGDQFMVDLDFNHQNTSDSFTVQGNGHEYGTFAYSDLFVTLGPFDGDGETVYEFLVCDQEQPDCCEDIAIDPVDCDTSDCSIRDLTAMPSPCDSNLFTINLDFIYEYTSDSFTVQGNGHEYGSFAYDDLPLDLGPFEGDGETVYEFLVCDQEQHDCCEDITIDPVECDTSDCSIRDLTATPSPCDSNLFTINLDFIHENTSDSFTVQGNGHEYGSFAYDDLPLDLGPFEGDGETVYEFLVCDQEQHDCCEDIAIDPVDCDTSDCSINELIAEAHPCEENTFYVDIAFEHENTSDSFTVVGNGHEYGTFAYSDLHITLGPFEAGGPEVLEFIVCDKGNPHCCREVVIHPPDCGMEECVLSDLCIRPNGCDGAHFYMEVDFEYQGVSGIGFDVFIDEEFYGFYSYEDLPLFLESPVPGDGKAHQIKICENDRPDCCVAGHFIAPVCSDCVFDEFEYHIVECQEGQFYLSIDFFPFQMEGDQYVITLGNDVLGLYEYDDLPQLIGPFAADGETSRTFHLYDAIEPACSRFLSINPVDCEMVSTGDPMSGREHTVHWEFAENRLYLTPTFALTDGQMVIYSTEGKVHFQRALTGSANRPLHFDVHQLSAGYYFASLKTGKGIFNFKFLILN